MAKKNTKNKTGSMRRPYAANSKLAAHRIHKNSVPTKRLTTFVAASRHAPRYSEKSTTAIITTGYICAGGHNLFHAFTAFIY